MNHNFGSLMASLFAWIAILAPNPSCANLQMPGDPPPPSILTHPPQNAWIFLVILFSVGMIASIALLALAFGIIRRARIMRRSAPAAPRSPPQSAAPPPPDIPQQIKRSAP